MEKEEKRPINREAEDEKPPVIHSGPMERRMYLHCRAGDSRGSL